MENLKLPPLKEIRPEPEAKPKDASAAGRGFVGGASGFPPAMKCLHLGLIAH